MMMDLIRKENLKAPHVSNPAFLAGLYTGAALITVMLLALFAANRATALEPYALERNAAAYTLFVALMLIPVCRFLHHPMQMFGAAMVAWSMFFIAYDIAGIYFHRLFDVLRTPFQALIEGAVIYGVIAVAAWVGKMLIQARRNSEEMAWDRARDANHDKT